MLVGHKSDVSEDLLTSSPKLSLRCPVTPYFVELQPNIVLILKEIGDGASEARDYSTDNYSKAGGVFPREGQTVVPGVLARGGGRAFEMTLGPLKRGGHNSPNKEPLPSRGIPGICLVESCSRGGWMR